ncbi:aspartate/glutamate racemase family protein [Ferviditalea candida]|uniref:Aspartate/glutamate racemase family protein n=1 Tax=Ferviditalea candida TaxID=3108399 RepID=A0ABU5ZCS5_9BACL|nr:aspartate/glutamate racemase family protein [Paenibacillaceae bacterium T2]
MKKTVVVVHTGPVTIQPLKDQFKNLLPDVRMINIMDDSLLNDVMSAGHLTKDVTQRIYSYMKDAEDMKADMILNACSSVGEATDVVKNMVNVPIIKIDEAMADQASEIGSKIGVLATVKTTLEPTVRLVKKKALEKNKEITVIERIAEGAFQALLDGNGEKHDQILKDTIYDLMEQVDVVVLAQVSMARLVPSLGETKVPVLSSPKSGVETLKKALEQLNS